MVKIKSRLIALLLPTLLGLGLLLLVLVSPAGQAQAQTAVPTGTPIAPGIITNTGDLTGLVTIPGPMTIPTITYTLDYSVLWDIDTLSTFYQVIITMPTFGVLQTFFKIFGAIVAVLAGIRIVQWILGTRQTDPETGRTFVKVGKREIEI